MAAHNLATLRVSDRLTPPPLERLAAAHRSIERVSGTFADGIASAAPVADANAGVEASVDTSDWHFGLAASLQDLERDWRRLERDARLSVHQSYDWCRAWELAHGQPLTIVTGSLNGRLAMILPLDIRRHHMVRTAVFAGGRHNNLNTGIFTADAAGSGPDFADSLSDALRLLLSDRTDLVMLSNVPPVWRGQPNPLAHLKGVPNQNHTFQLPLKPTMEETISQLNRKSRKRRFTRQKKRLDELGGYRYVVAGTATERLQLLDRFFQQKAERFRLMGLPDVFADPETQTFFRLLADRETEGHDHLLSLHALVLKGDHDGHVAAISATSRKGDHVICQFSSFDDSVAAEASPGDFLYWLMTERLIAEGAEIFDFGVGDQQFKRAWCPTHTEPMDYMLPVSALGSLAAFIERGAIRAKAAIKANPALYAAIQRLRARGQAACPQQDEAAET